MLTYRPTVDRPAAQSQDKPWLLLLLCLFWLLPGLVGHDPWKPHENESMAIVAYFMRSSDWTLAWVAGIPQFEQAPLYYWCAALLANALAWFGVVAHDAARLSTGLWMALAMWGTGLAARELFGRRFGRVAVVILLGSLGLPLWAHHISPAIILLCGFAWLAYALILATRLPVRAGVIMALVFLVLLTGASWADALLAALIAFSLPIFPMWRRASYGITLMTALLIAFPFAALWGYALKTLSPELFQIWWRFYAWGPYGGAKSFVYGNNLLSLPSLLIWFAWPALPLAAWAFYVFRKELSQARWQLLLLMLVAQFLYIALAGKASEVLALPLLMTLSLIACAAVDELRHGAAAALNWFSMFALGLAALIIWLCWFALVTGMPQAVALRLQAYGVNPMSMFGFGVAFAVLVTLLWGRILFRKRPIGRRALTNWACGVTLLGGLLVGLFQSWVDSGKSYRPVATGVIAAMKSYPEQCIDVAALAQDPISALSYFSYLKLKATAVNDCQFVMQQGLNAAAPVGAQLIWQGQRLGNKQEFFSLYHR